jgi:hypothetical protein
MTSGVGYVGRRPTARVLCLLMVVGALAVINWRLMVMSIDISPAGGDEPDSLPTVEAAAAGRFEPKPLSTFPETEARPLFSPTRRPRAAGQTAVDATPPTPSRSAPDLRLVGVMMIAPAQKRALFRSPLEPRGHWISEGGLIDGWKVLTVGANAVVIEGRGGRHHLTLPRSGANRGTKH